MPTPSVPVGVGVAGTIAGLVVTLAEKLGGNYAWAAGHYLLNLTRGTTIDITGLTMDGGNPNLITAITVSSIPGGWVSGDKFVLQIGNSVTTSATINGGLTAVDAGGVVFVYAANAAGSRQYLESPTLGAKSWTLQCSVVGNKYSMLPGSGATAGYTYIMSDLHFVGTSYWGVMYTWPNGSTVTWNRCLFSGVSIFAAYGGVTIFNINRCIFVDAGNTAYTYVIQNGWAGGGNTNIINSKNVLIVNPMIAGGFAGNASAVHNCTNCAVWMKGTCYTGITGGSNNASADATAPGANPQKNVTLSQFAFARELSPVGGSMYPYDFRTIDGQGSLLENNGTPIGGDLIDFDGRAVDPANPNIGPVEGFTGFAAAEDDSSESSLSQSSASESSASGTSVSGTSLSGTSLSESSLSESSASETTATSLSTATTATSVTSDTSTSSTNDAVWPAEEYVLPTGGPYGPTGDEYTGTLDIAAPGAPSITAHSTGDGSVTITVDGDAGVTNELWYRTVSGTWTLGGSRSGDGNITKSSLTNGTAYEVCARSKSAGGVYGPPSGTIMVVPGTGASVPTSNIDAYCYAMRYRYMNSPTFNAWIQSVDGDGQATGRVILGHKPPKLPDLVTGGPVALIRWENFRAENAGSAGAFRAFVDIVVDHVWQYSADRQSRTFIAEMGYISKIVEELAQEAGITFDPIYGKGGHIVAVDAPNALEQDPDDQRVWHSEIRYTIGYGVDP